MQRFKGRLRADGTRVGKRDVRRYTLYCTPEVVRRIELDAVSRGVSQSRVVDEILARHYGVAVAEAAE